jgi:hypothetical protein
MTMTFEQAAERQHRYGSYYTVWLLGPDGEREYLGFTARKSGAGLLKFMSSLKIQERMKQFPDADNLRCTKTATALIFTSKAEVAKAIAEGRSTPTPNGWKIQFGGTIRQEAAESNLEKKS